MNDDDLEKHYIEELNSVGGKSMAYYITGVVFVGKQITETIKIKEADFLFTSKCYNGERTFDSLSRLEYDKNLKKYFCQLNKQELFERELEFNEEIRRFILKNL